MKVQSPKEIKETLVSAETAGAELKVSYVDKGIIHIATGKVEEVVCNDRFVILTCSFKNELFPVLIEIEKIISIR